MPLLRSRGRLRECFYKDSAPLALGEKAAEGRRTPGRWRVNRRLPNRAERLGVRQSSGALGMDGAHFRRDIAAKGMI